MNNLGENSHGPTLSLAKLRQTFYREPSSFPQLLNSSQVTVWKPLVSTIFFLDQPTRQD